ncbi:putative snRNA-activating protein complex subunit isoform X2 [Iris pallida]|uniref:snRNA-activating protein complex subunit isoform X2 n=1 Tax=Iris pallida TaxID=29817 RepID=A0AAX6H3D6_IRIPA|nr:putative snRNA-activating protein complex subunit isoform X2 [Iris pallida]
MEQMEEEEEEEECQYFEEELEEEEEPPQQQQWGSSSASSRKLPFARGGPIFVPDLVSSPISVPQFLSSFLQHLYGLEAELAASAASEDGDSFDDELSVDELRVFTEEELVEKALEDDDFHDRCANSIAGGSTISGKEIVCSENRAINGSNLGPSSDSINSSIVACETDGLEGKLRHKKNKKRGRVFDRDSRAAQLEGSYFAKVKELAKLKQKQDEDKLAAKLHSFRSNSKPVEESVSTTEKTKRMRSLRFITSSVKVNPCTSKAHVPLRSPEIVLCVEIYHKKNVSKKTQEFLVLGSQLLSELRDNIYCLTDKLMQTAGQHDPSGYFLIEDTFCNDLRDPSSSDYSKPIFDWLNNCKNEAEEKWKQVLSGEMKKMHKKLLVNVDTSNLPIFKSAKMDEIRFSDLHFRLGAGYLYCHQGNCKHIIVIRDMRSVHPEDVQNEADYPLHTFQLRPRHRKCQVCKIYHVSKMTVDDKWAPRNPCYFCIKCYFLLHYKEDGSLLYPHSVYDYYHELMPSRLN